LFWSRVRKSESLSLFGSVLSVWGVLEVELVELRLKDLLVGQLRLILGDQGWG
jgi:hypothetical protein